MLAAEADAWNSSRTHDASHPSAEFYPCHEPQANCQCTKGKVDAGHCGGPPGCYTSGSQQECEGHTDKWLGNSNSSELEHDDEDDGPPTCVLGCPGAPHEDADEHDWCSFVLHAELSEFPKPDRGCFANCTTDVWAEIHEFVGKCKRLSAPEPGVAPTNHTRPTAQIIGGPEVCTGTDAYRRVSPPKMKLRWSLDPMLMTKTRHLSLAFLLFLSAKRGLCFFNIFA